MPNSWRISTACCIVSQSEFEPITTPTWIACFMVRNFTFHPHLPAMIDITLENFQSELIDGSMTTPVLLDIWAELVRALQTAGPGARKARRRVRRPLQAGQARRRQGAADLRQLSQMFGVRSIPFCVMFKDGQPVDGFVGAIRPTRSAPSSTSTCRRRAAKPPPRKKRRPRRRWPRATPRARSRSCSTRSPPTRPTTTPASTTSSCCCRQAAPTTPRSLSRR